MQVELGHGARDRSRNSYAKSFEDTYFLNKKAVIFHLGHHECLFKLNFDIKAKISSKVATRRQNVVAGLHKFEEINGYPVYSSPFPGTLSSIGGV